MEIVCPECGFSRNLPPDRLPARTVIATCPECSCRFRFSPESGVLGKVEEASAPKEASAPNQAQAYTSTDYQDDPLPPGAVIPTDDDDDIKTDIPPEQQEEDDIRVVASKAYAREAARLENDGEDAGDAPVAIPWEQAPQGYGWFAAFYHTIIRVMFSAPRLFSALTPNVRQTRALGFYLIVGVIQIFVERFWLLSLLEPAASSDPQLAKMMAMLVPQTSPAMVIILRTFILVLELYFFSALIHFACRFTAPGQADFSLVFQVVSYSSAPTLLCVVPILGSLAGFVWSVACMLTGCRSALRLTWTQTLIAFTPVLFVMLFFMQLFLNVPQV